jgi:hypothetical protein
MAQDPGSRSKSNAKTESKPFRVLTNGRHITVQSNEDIQRVLVWNTTGHRIAEQTNFNSPSYNFTVPNSEKLIFLMVQLKNGKYYTDKVGVR